MKEHEKKQKAKQEHKAIKESIKEGLNVAELLDIDLDEMMTELETGEAPPKKPKKKKA